VWRLEGGRMNIDWDFESSCRQKEKKDLLKTEEVKYTLKKLESIKKRLIKGDFTKKNIISEIDRIIKYIKKEPKWHSNLD
jgi:hypothetical protein